MKKETADKILAQVCIVYDTIAPAFSATRIALWPEMEAVKKLVKTGDGILDIGCGNGRAYQLFEGMAIEYEGIDSCVEFIRQAKESVRSANANFRVGSMLALPYGDTSFDIALMIAALHHMPSDRYRRFALREANRVLKPGGYLFMTNWNRWKTHWPQMIWNAVKSIAGPADYDLGDVLVPWKAGGKFVSRYFHSFRPGELARLCTATGFEVIDQYYVKAGQRVSWWKGGNLVTVCRTESRDLIPGLDPGT